MCDFLLFGQKIVPLTVDMKGIVMKISAVLVAIWYCMGIVGFHVHTCNETGRVYVATFAEGLTCADIHPEYHCGASHDHDCCCAHHSADETVVDTGSCCTDVYQVIDLSGFRADDSSRHHDDGHFGPCPCLLAESVSYPALQKYRASLQKASMPDPGDILPCELRVVFSVWRI